MAYSTILLLTIKLDKIMKRHLTCLIAVMMLGASMPALAAVTDTGGDVDSGELQYPECAILPPDGAEIQKWEFHYDYYLVCCVQPAWRYDYHLEWQDVVRPVDCVIDGSYIYIRGLSMNIPEFWIRGEISSDDEVVFPNGQLMGTYQSKPNGTNREMYFTPSVFGSDSGGSNVWHWVDIVATPTLKDLRCSYDRDSGIIIPYDLDLPGKEEPGYWYPEDWHWYWYYGDFGFSLSADENECLSGGYIMDKDGDYIEYRDDKDMYFNVSFRRANTGDVEEIIGDAGSADSSIYDLNGRRVSSRPLSPGIYIRSGKKFVVR